MIIIQNYPFFLNGKKWVSITATHWNELKKLIQSVRSYEEVVQIILRDDPTFKKGGYDHIRINLSDPRGEKLFAELQKDPFNGLIIGDKAYEVGVYQLKISRLQARGEWDSKIKEFMMKHLRGRVVGMLKAGEWIDEEAHPKEKRRVIKDWQGLIRSVDLGRQDGLRYVAAVQTGKFQTKKVKMDSITGSHEPTEQELLKEAKETRKYRRLLESHPEHKITVIGFKIEDGEIQQSEFREWFQKPIEELF